MQLLRYEQTIKFIAIYAEKTFDKLTSIFSDNGKEISMEYIVIEERDGMALCQVLLHTGRSHQIRAYFSSIGCPLVGDKKYGALSGGGQMLIAYKIRFAFSENYNGVLSYLNNQQIQLDNIPFLW